eukprot:gene11579-1701_t
MAAALAPAALAPAGGDIDDRAVAQPLPPSDDEQVGHKGWGKYGNDLDTPKLTRQQQSAKTAYAAAEGLIGKATAAAFKRQLDEHKTKKLTPAVQAEGDAIIRTMLDLGKLTKYHFVNAFGVGYQRFNRVSAASGKAPAQANRKTDEEKCKVEEYINAVDTEQGLACTHKAQREYLLEGDLVELHTKYVKEEIAAGRSPYAYDYFFNIVSKVRPFLRKARLRTDMCNACMRIDNLLKNDPNMTPEQRELLLAEKKLHYEESKAQREAYN